MPRGTGTSAPWPSDRFTLLLAVVTAAGSSAAQNLTVCATNQLDWYTSVVRETPCRTYERLRQICDKDYTVGQFNNTAPGDSCNSPCCCNSIAWNLSMLCLNCQVAGRTTPQPNGIDADVGSYESYLAQCGFSTNGTLPKDIQSAVNARQIDLRPTLYDPPWLNLDSSGRNGAWFYTYFRDRMWTPDLAVETGNNSTNGTGISASAPTPSPNTLSVGALAGGVAGGVVALLCALLVLVLWRRRRRRVHQVYGEVGSEHGGPAAVPDPFIAGTSAPPPYAASLRKSELAAARLYLSAPVPEPGGGASSFGLGAGLGRSTSTYNGSSTLGSWREDSGPVGGSPEDAEAAVFRAKKSGWRLSEKPPSSDAQ